uniref:Uncharacterized protein n=1 Tax=Oryza brachyantha TaxID=4533 RepID=J3M2F5_ORYBR
MAAPATAATEALPSAGSPCTSSRPRRACHSSDELRARRTPRTALPLRTGCLQKSTGAQVFIGSAESAAATERLKATWHISHWAGKSPAHRLPPIGQINLGAFRAIWSRSSRQLGHLEYGTHNTTTTTGAGHSIPSPGIASSGHQLCFSLSLRVALGASSFAAALPDNDLFFWQDWVICGDGDGIPRQSWVSGFGFWDMTKRLPFSVLGGESYSLLFYVGAILPPRCSE